MRRRRRRDAWETAWRFAIVAALALAAGAIMEAMFDPRSGRRRRALARDKVVHWSHVGSRKAKRTGRAIRSGAAAMRHRAQHQALDHVNVDDRTLEARVQSMAFRDPRMPKGAIMMDVSEGVVVLRGALPDTRAISTAEAIVRGVPGVRGVENLLHVAGTDAPNKHDALAASELFMQERVLPEDR